MQLFQAYHTVHPLPRARPELAKVYPTAITLLSRQGRPPSCLPISVGHRDDVETRGRWTGPQLLIHLPHPRHRPTRRGSRWVTHLYHALSPLSTCGKTPPRCGTNSRHRAGSGRRCCSTDLGSRTSSEPLCPRASRPTQILIDSALDSMPPPSQAAQGVGQAFISLSPQCSST